jgi:hypothetical protein
VVSEGIRLMARSSRKGAKKPNGNGGEIIAAAPLKMRDVRCDSLSYRFRVSLDKFNVGALRSAVHVDEKTKKNFHVVNTRDPQVADYHAHFEWRIREKQEEITVDIKYVANPVESSPGEQEPFSDNLMQWVGQFFKHGDANAKIHSDFDFDAKTAAHSWFPLPLRTKVANLAGEAILDGISVALPSQPDSVSRFFLSHIKDSVFVGIESQRRINFADFSLNKEIQLERAFADKLIEVKS